MKDEEFKTPFQIILDKRNRWITLVNSLLWTLASIYSLLMNAQLVAPGIDARKVISAMRIKPKLKSDDSETIETIHELY